MIWIVVPQCPSGVVNISGCTGSSAPHCFTFSTTPTTRTTYHGFSGWFARMISPSGSLFGQALATISWFTTTPRMSPTRSSGRRVRPLINRRPIASK